MSIHRAIGLGLVASLCCWPHAGRAGTETPWSIKLAPVGGAHRIFTRPGNGQTQGKSSPALLQISLQPPDQRAARAEVVLSARDFLDRASGWNASLAVEIPAGGKMVDSYLALPNELGYYSIRATATIGGERRTAWTDLGIVAAPHVGTRSDSFFASNTSGMKGGEDLELLQAIGMKVERVHFTPPLATRDHDWPRHLPAGQTAPLDFVRQDQQWAETRARGLWVLPIVGYCLQGAGTVDSSLLAQQTGMHGPPADYDRFVNTWAAILRHYPELTTLEFWNEPWIFGWSWAGSAAEYRRLQKQFCTMALAVNPRYRIVAGNSTMFAADNIEPEPGCWQGLLAGVSHHPYCRSTGEASYRPGDHLRSIDDIVLLARRMHLPFAYLTEGGTEYRSARPAPAQAIEAELERLKLRIAALSGHEPIDRDAVAACRARQRPLQEQLAAFPDPHNNLENAAKVVQYYVKAMLAGVYQGNAQWQIGYGPGWTQSNVAFAVMTHFLEDRPPLADIWPSNELIWGGVFAHPRFVADELRKLPRAAELSARWGVAVPNDRADDQTKVAVVWSLTGTSNDQLDGQGTLSLDARGLAAFDIMGRRIPAQGHRLVVPFGPAPVYIASDALSVAELRDRVAAAGIERVTPVNLYALSLASDPARPQQLAVRVENQLNRRLQGVLKLQIDGAAQTTSAPLVLEPAGLAEVHVAWPGVARSTDNQYAVTLSASVGTPPTTVSRRQVVAMACFRKRTITVDGDLGDWNGIVPVLLDSRMLESGVDLSQYLLNPHLQRPVDAAASQRIVARVYTAYDEHNVYLAAAVVGASGECSAGEAATRGRGAIKVVLPYRNAMPGGLGHVVNSGDVLQLAFGFRERVPGYGRQINDPYAWKGAFYDTDACYAAHASSEGDRLIRLWGPATARRNGYQTESVPGLEAVPGARIKIVRDEQARQTIYELAIPRTELSLFDPAAGRLRFGFILYDKRLPGGNNGLNWSDAAGVFDHWRNSGSFPPTWMQRTACQTFFGIEP
jgi:hypothetical protein